MKNKIKVLLFFLLINYLSLPLFSNDTNLNFSVTPVFGLKFGSIGEYVFSKSSTGADFSHVPDEYKQISYLEWDIIPLLTLGINSSLNYKDFYLGIDLATSIHNPSGKMKDYDWLGPNGVLTRYSCHPNQITNFFFGKFLIGWKSFIPEQKFFWRTALGVEFERIDFLATDGYKQYVPNDATEWTEDIEKVELHGDIISYAQESLLLVFSNKISWLIQPKLILGFSFDIKPILLFNGYDSHFKRDLDFYDTNMQGTIPISVAIESEYQLTQKTWANFKIVADWVSIINGDVYTKESTDTYYSSDPFSSGGSSKWTTGIEAGVKIVF